MQGQPQPQGQGIDSIPVPEQMFEPQGMAGGGIVAMQAGGTPSFSGLYSNVTPEMEEIRRLLGAYPGETDEQRAARRKEGQAMRLIEAGLGIAGGTSPYFAANLAGAAPAIRGYSEDIRSERKEDLARQMGQRGETAKILDTVVAGRRSAAEQAQQSARATAELTSREGISKADRESRERVAEADRASREATANLPPEIVRGAKAIQMPGENLNDAVARYATLNQPYKDQFNAAAGLVQAAYKSASERFNTSIGASGPNYRLALAASGDESSLRTLKITKEEARKRLANIQNEYLTEAYAGVGMTPERANQYLLAPRGSTSTQPTGAAASGQTSFSEPPPAAVNFLRQDFENRAAEFDRKYGPGAAQRYRLTARDRR
jgi:hypothetical protein